jgi:hypothetical protein
VVPRPGAWELDLPVTGHFASLIVVLLSVMVSQYFMASLNSWKLSEKAGT